MSMQSTGMIMHNRTTGKDYAMHAECAQAMGDLQTDLGMTIFPDTRIVVEIGPLFAEPSEWTCAYGGCKLKGKN